MSTTASPGFISKHPGLNTVEVLVTTTAQALINGGITVIAIIVKNISDATVYIGNSTVTVANGFPIAVNESMILEMDLVTYDNLYLIHGGTGNKAVRVAYFLQA